MSKGEGPGHEILGLLGRKARRNATRAAIAADPAVVPAPLAAAEVEVERAAIAVRVAQLAAIAEEHAAILPLLRELVARFPERLPRPGVERQIGGVDALAIDGHVAGDAHLLPDEHCREDDLAHVERGHCQGARIVALLALQTVTLLRPPPERPAREVLREVEGAEGEDERGGLLLPAVRVLEVFLEIGGGDSSLRLQTVKVLHLLRGRFFRRHGSTLLGPLAVSQRLGIIA